LLHCAVGLRHQQFDFIVGWKRGFILGAVYWYKSREHNHSKNEGLFSY
jgi:hypothetical protein